VYSSHVSYKNVFLSS